MNTIRIVEVKSAMSGRLTLVGTPIGNLSDMSPRAVEALEACDFIAAEDTRVTLRLLNHFGVKKPLVSYYEHNKRTRGEALCARLLAGENGVLVSDAGMPAISDPGEDLVALCHEKGIPVGVVPGPSAVVTALAIAGLPTRPFHLRGVSQYEQAQPAGASGVAESRAPHHGVLRGAPQAALYPGGSPGGPGRSAYRSGAGADQDPRGSGAHHLGRGRRRYREEAPRGEFVVVVEGAAPPQAPPASPEDGAALAGAYVREGLSPSEAAKRAAAETGLKKGDIYRLLME